MNIKEVIDNYNFNEEEPKPEWRVFQSRAEAQRVWSKEAYEWITVLCNSLPFETSEEDIKACITYYYYKEITRSLEKLSPRLKKKLKQYLKDGTERQFIKNMSQEKFLEMMAKCYEVFERKDEYNKLADEMIKDASKKRISYVFDIWRKLRKPLKDIIDLNRYCVAKYLKLDEEIQEYLKNRAEVRKRGFRVYADISGVLYVYKLTNNK